MTLISKEYAEALFELASETGAEREFDCALHLIEDELSAQPDYADLLSSPNIPKNERCALLDRAFADSVPEYVLSTAKLLCERGRMRDFGEVVREYDSLYRALELISVAQVTSAVELTNEEKEALTERLEKMCGHTVTSVYTIDPSILGGIVVRMDDTLIDGSLKRKLKDVKEVIGK